MDGLSDWVRRFHLGGETVRAAGTFDVRRGERWLGRLVGVVLRFPPSGRAVPVRVEVVRTGVEQPERWVRQIGRRRLASWQVRSGAQLREGFGPFELRMRIVPDGTGLRLVPDGAAVCLGTRRWRLPYWCAPQAAAEVWVPADRQPAAGQPDGDPPGAPRFELRVRISVPSAGLLLSYSGQVEERVHG